MSIRIRSEDPADAPAIEEVTVAAFLNAAHSSHTEHFIINELRRAGQLAVSLVAEENGEIIGHVAVSPVTVSGGEVAWYGLGPVSVTPARQDQGVGLALVEQALSELRSLGADGCVVLGDPNYYRRFGFEHEALLVLPGVPPEYFQALAFRRPLPAGEVAYHDAFDAKG